MDQRLRKRLVAALGLLAAACATPVHWYGEPTAPVESLAAILAPQPRMMIAAVDADARLNLHRPAIVYVKPGRRVVLVEFHVTDLSKLSERLAFEARAGHSYEVTFDPSRSPRFRLQELDATARPVR